MSLYLVWHDGEQAIEPEALHGVERVALRPGLLLIDSEETRSKLYHRIKWALPTGIALLVAPLSDAPKFKGLQPGALRWLRERE